MQKNPDFEFLMRARVRVGFGCLGSKMSKNQKHSEREREREREGDGMGAVFVLFGEPIEKSGSCLLGLVGPEISMSFPLLI